ncbi:MAG: hypothetical protein QOE37_2356 [Microbacteriaceae bacterium]|nr:hypothetical protein [Microbacteriaceae bacterium]
MSIRRQESLWPTRVPKDSTMHEIRQIVLCIYDCGPEENAPGMISVFHTNTYKRPIPEPELLTLFPASYKYHLHQLLARFRMLLFAHDFIDSGCMLVRSNRDAILKHLRCYVHYTDSVLDSIWDEADSADSLGPDWRSAVLDKWMVYDYYVGGHTPQDVELFLTEHNENAFEEDPMEFGAYHISCITEIVVIVIARLGGVGRQHAKLVYKPRLLHPRRSVAWSPGSSRSGGRGVDPEILGCCGRD